MEEYVRDLSETKRQIAEEAKLATSEIVQDAIDKHCYGLPVSFHYTCSEPVDSYTFCHIPTKEFLQDLLTKLSEIHFKEDTDPEESNTFAYVIPDEKTDIVYLCNCFWGANNVLSKDSKPGIIIHEVSHLLGTEDIFYQHMTVELFEQNKTLLGKSQLLEKESGMERHREEVFQVNANSLAHEFETIINHTSLYSDTGYPCCGETKKNSVCGKRSTGHYYLHERFPYRKEDMERKMTKGIPEGRKIKYVMKKNQACEKIPVSEP